MSDTQIKMSPDDLKATKARLEMMIFCELVSTIRMIRDIGSEDYVTGARILRAMRRFEKTKPDETEGRMAGVLLDCYFQDLGDWAKMETRLTDIARDSGVDMEAAAKQIADIYEKKLEHARRTLK